MDMVVQLEEFKHFPDTYIHRFEQESDTGLEMNLLQKYLFVPLDIFQKIQHNKNGEIKIANRLEAWLSYVWTDRKRSSQSLRSIRILKICTVRSMICAGI